MTPGSVTRSFLAGRVAPRAADRDFSHLRTSYGVGLRVHTRQSTVGRLDVGHSREGWRGVFKLNDPFKRATLSGGRTEVIPFVPCEGVAMSSSAVSLAVVSPAVGL